MIPEAVMAAEDLVREAEGAAREMSSRIPGSVESGPGRELRVLTRTRVSGYFGRLWEQLPMADLSEYAQHRIQEYRDRAIEKADMARLRRDAGIIVNDAVEGTSGELGTAIYAPTAQGYIEGDRQVARSFGAPVAAGLIGLQLSAGRFRRPVLRDVADWAAERCASKITGINAATKRRLAGIAADAIRDGKDVAATGRAIRERFGEMSRMRSELIANDMINHAMSTGAHNRAAALRCQEKSWLTGGSAPCPQCETNEAAGRVAMFDLFPSGHTHTPAHVRCLCAVAYFRV